MGAEHKTTETFSSVDAAWLHMDTPTNLAVITGVLTFPGRMDEARLKYTLEQRLLIFNRFRQRVVEPPLKIGLPRWETAPNFHIDQYVERIELPKPQDHTVLQQVVGDMMSQPLERGRSPWKYYLADLSDGGSAVIVRLHHCIADGMALIQVLLSIADATAAGDDAPPLEIRPERQPQGMLDRILQPAAWAARKVGQTWQTAGSLAHEGMQTLIHPSRLGDAARFSAGATRALGKLLLIPPDRKTVLRGKCGVEKRAVWSVAIDLDEVKGISRLMGGTINDILLSALTGGLRRYLEQRGDMVHALNIRAVVPVSLRPADDLDKMGNRFGLVFLSLPVGVEDPLKRLITLKRRMNAIKESPEALVAFGILTGMGLTPIQIEQIILTIFAMKGTGVVTNVPGPRRPLYFAGQLIDTLMFWVPTPGNLGLGVSILSYNNQVFMGVSTDAGLIPDPENILEAFKNELEFLKNWGRPPARSSQADSSETPVLKSLPLSEDSYSTPAAIPPAATHSEAEAIPERAQCHALTRAGARCRNRALPGQATCRRHSLERVEIHE